jgi:hypothetical protein
MAFETRPERAYPYRTDHVPGVCVYLSFVAAGAFGFLVCLFIGRGILTGELTGVALGLFAGLAPLAPWLPLVVLPALSVRVKNALRPPRVRATPAALLLPAEARGDRERDENGYEKLDAPYPQPELIPFAAIRWVRREGWPNRAKLVIVHDLSQTTLVIEQSLMRPADFDELETLLRAAVPGAFAALPVPSSRPTDGV